MQHKQVSHSSKAGHHQQQQCLQAQALGGTRIASSPGSRAAAALQPERSQCSAHAVQVENTCLVSNTSSSSSVQCLLKWLKQGSSRMVPHMQSHFELNAVSALTSLQCVPVDGSSSR